MKTINSISTCALLSFSATMVHADITYTAPGMEAPYVTTELQKHVHHDMGKFWKYIITGYEYQLNAGVPDGGRVKGGQLRYQNGSQSFPGETTLKTKVNGQQLFSKTLNTSSFSGTTGLISQNLPTEIIIEDQEITLCLQYSSNMIGGNDHIILHGAALLAPPVPIGTLIAPSYVRDGGKPTLEWFITKSLSDDIVIVEIPVCKQPSPNEGPVKSNNGHGNNLDGIDVSNPGKSAARWAKKGIYDTDYNGDGTYEDDEGHGGGSAISQTPKLNPVAVE